jgi:hypothetical protein
MLIACISLLVVSMMTGMVSAITNGQPDGGEHPYVCLVVADVYIPDVGNVPAWRGTGVLIAPDVVVTAGHVTDGAAAVRVWFAESVEGNPDYPAGGPSAIEGTPYTNPEFCIGCGNGLPGFAYRDIGVIVLDEPVVMTEYGVLPTAGLVDTLAMMTDVDIVGYGVQTMVRGGGPPYWTGLRSRLQASAQVITSPFTHSDEFVRITANPGRGKGGTSFGDSGGPVLLADTNVFLSVNSYVTSYQSVGVTYSSRIDIPDVLAWINSFLT